MKKFKPIIPVLISLSLFTCTNNAIAQSIKIGTQTWATKNLDVSSFRNGDAIPEAKTDAEWIAAGELGKPAWCYYKNDRANGTKYGKLYNWYAVNDPRGLAPKGWHVSSDAEWTILTDYLGGQNGAGTQLKSASDWEDYGNGSNSSGFAGLPGGYRNGVNGTFNYIGASGCWWSSSASNADDAWYRRLSYEHGSVYRNYLSKLNGFSIRCLED